MDKIGLVAIVVICDQVQCFAVLAAINIGGIWVSGKCQNSQFL